MREQINGAANMKTQKDRENKNLSIFCGVLVVVMVAFVVFLGAIVNLAVSKEVEKAIDYSKRTL